MTGNRPIRSYVMRRGARMTPAQHRAIECHRERYLLSAGACLDPPRAFGREAPLILDTGPGNGESTLAMAAARPDCNVLAVEVYPSGIGSLLSNAARKNIDNIRVIRQDVNEVLVRYMHPASIDAVLIWFPDPWPKKRHQKRRLVSARFLELLALHMKPGAYAWFATDCKAYAEAVGSHVQQQTLLLNPAGAGRYAPRPRWRAPTRYERRARQAGRAVYDLAIMRAG